MKIRCYLPLFCFYCLLPFSKAQQAAPYVPDPDPAVRQKLDDWQDLKFGLLMHWGAYSQWGVVESWSICSEDWIDRKGADYSDYVQRYEQLPKTFNPTQFDPDRWAAAAKDAGMRYVVFTTKHHDGFAMFDSKYTDYKITGPDCAFRSHPKADVAKYIFDSFRQQGFWAGAYFSKPDWHCPDYWAPEWATPDRCNNYDIRRYPDRWQRYEDFTYHQIEELMTRYGDMDILWLDGGWVRPDSTINDEVRSWGYNLPKWGQNMDMHRIVRMARQHQPGLLVVDRSVHGPYENYRTPEQQVPGKTLPYPWETCMTMSDSWSHSPNARYKSTRDLVQMLVDIVSKGGNFLLNVGPAPDGQWDSLAYARLAEIGDWMQVNAAAIYGTRPLAPFKEGKVCLTQKKDGQTAYLLYLPDEDEAVMPSKIWVSSFHSSPIRQVRLLGTSEPLKWEAVGKGIEVSIPEKFRKKPPCQWAWAVEVKY